MVQSNRTIPLARRLGVPQTGTAGMRPSMRRLVDRVDQADPAFLFVAAELHRIRRTGGELDESAIVRAVEAGRRQHAQYRQDEDARQPGRIPDSIVYYARRGDLVKIGTTTRPHQRFSSLLPDEIMAWEPGGRTEEALRHDQFKGLRLSTTAEYFRRDEVLDAHIAEVRQAHGAPDPTWPTIGGLASQPTRAKLPEIPVTVQLVTLEEGTRQLGIRIGTARVWIHRGKLDHIVEDALGRKFYFLSDLISLSKRKQGPAEVVEP